MVELLRAIKPQLPEGYRAYLGTVPTVAVGAPTGNPDVRVRHDPNGSPSAAPPSPRSAAPEQPDIEIAIATLDPATSLFVETRGRLVAAVELISPRNEDRPTARANSLARYLGYLLEGVHLLLVDVHRRPLDFSFADGIAQELQLNQPPLPPPMAVSYQVGEPAATGGRVRGIWRRPLAIEAPLLTMTLAINHDTTVSVDLERTYMRAAADAYLT
jgi:hypothetical protein